VKLVGCKTCKRFVRASSIGALTRGLMCWWIDAVSRLLF